MMVVYFRLKYNIIWYFNTSMRFYLEDV